MAKGRKFLNEDDDRWLATCELNNCDWDRICENEEVAKVISVLHTVTKHPHEYEKATGKDPEQSKRQYAKILEEAKRHL